MATPFWEQNLILRVRAGSRAYGLAGPDSDEDIRGICIPPKEYLLGLKTFEQHEYEGKDHVVYTLSKFVRLALQGNPNIIEILWTEPPDILSVNRFGDRLRQARPIFLTRRVGERFSRYAAHQLHRLENHYRWLRNPPAGAPDPAAFGGRLVGGRVRFPDTDAERNYQATLKAWNHYQRWRRERNPERAALEERFGYDTKHAMHLLRLLQMGYEILRDGAVRVRRPDADWLRGVREGRMTYEEVLQLASEKEKEIPALVRSSSLPEEPDSEAAERLVVEIQEAFIFRGI